MQGTGTGVTAMLAGTSGRAGGRRDAATVTLAREEIEEALSSDLPLELVLSVRPGDGVPRDVHVAWQRTDLESVLAGVEAGPVTFSFDRSDLYRALEHPDFEGHGMREIVLLVAAASASAALMTSTASAQVMDAGGGGTIGAAMDASGGGTIGAAMDASGGGTTGAAMDASGGGTTGAAMDASGGGTTGAAMDASGGGTTGAAMDASGGGTTGAAMDASGGGTTGAAMDASGGGTTGAAMDASGGGTTGAAAIAPGHDEATTAGALAAPADSGTAFELPSVDTGTAAVAGGLAGAGLLILGGAFAVRRQRVTPV